jgi:DNA-binding transcriptional regulator YiaG
MDGLADMTDLYHYTDCGLDYVWLLNGFTFHRTPHGDGVSIKDARALHARLALDMIAQPHPLQGQDVRFLRGLLRVSQEGLARVLRQQRGSVARWEADPNKDIPGAADSALRMFYALKAGGHDVAVKVVDLLQEIDELQHGPHKICMRNDGEWLPTAA